MNKYNRINDLLSADGNNGSQSNGHVERQPQQSSQPQQQQQRLHQSLHNRIQRRYEADGSEEDEIQRHNHIMSSAQPSSSSQPIIGSAFAGQPSAPRNGSGEEMANSLLSNVSNISNIDANSLYSKLKELQEAEQRLKQVEDLMKSIEKMENNIKEVKRDSIVNNESSQRVVKSSNNDIQTKFHTRSHNMTKSSTIGKSLVSHSTQTQPKLLPPNHHSMANNHISGTHSQHQKNVIPRNIDDINHLDMNVNTNAVMNAIPPQPPHVMPSHTMDFCDNNLGYNTDVDESESNSEESFNLMNGNLIRSMRSQFDSMRSQFETMLPTLESQTYTNVNTDANMTSNMNINHNNSQQNSTNNNNMNINGNNNCVNNQFFHLMLLQNYQILQQQQMLIIWLQNQQNQCQTPLHGPPPPPQHHSQPIPQPLPQRHHQNHTSHHYMNNSRNPTNHSLIGQNSVHYQNSGMNSMRNNTSNVHNMTALNNQVVPGVRANNYWDNFKSYSRQNKLSANSGANSKTNENLTLTHNQTVSPPLMTASDHQMVHQNTNQSHDTGGGAKGLSPNSRHAYHKAANASHVPSHVQCAEHAEKQQNLPQFNADLMANKTQTNSDSNNFAALFSILEKLIESDDKFASVVKTQRKKSTNLVITADKDDELSGGAVGGVGVVAGVANVNNQLPTDESDSSSGGKCQPQPSTPSSSRSQNIAIPLHIPASSGAIRKKPRNQEILELSSKADNSEQFGHPLISGSELIRPLMAAEGRSSEISVKNTAAVTPKTPILSTRPPTTGWPYDRNSDSNSSSDDQLAEADQTASELIVTETESIHSNGNTINSNINGNSITTTTQSNPVNVQIVDTTQRSLVEENEVIANEIVAEDEDEDSILANDLNEGAIRLSGDGEQGL